MFSDPDELSVCVLLSNSNIAMADPALVLLGTIFVSGTKIDKITEAVSKRKYYFKLQINNHYSNMLAHVIL